MTPLWDASEVELHKLISVPDGSRCMGMQVLNENYIAMNFQFPNGSINSVIYDPFKKVDWLIIPNFDNKTAYSIIEPG